MTAAQRGVGIGFGPELLGRVIDARGCPIDGGPPLTGLPQRALANPNPLALERPLIEDPLPTGVRAIDAMATIGAGQRMGIFAGPGVGKSTLLGQVVRHAEVEVSVIALVGERSREVREFIDDVLGLRVWRILWWWSPQGKKLLCGGFGRPRPRARLPKGFGRREKRRCW